MKQSNIIILVACLIITAASFAIQWGESGYARSHIELLEDSQALLDAWDMIDNYGNIVAYR